MDARFSDPEIAKEIEFLEDRYFVFDEPVPFNGLMIYPVSIKNYIEFMTSVQCLLLNKNDDIKGIRLTNLDYLISKIQDSIEGPLWSMRFSKIVELCFHVKPGMKCSKCQKVMRFDEYLKRIEEYEDTVKKTFKPPFDYKKCAEDGCDGDLIPSIDLKVDESGKRHTLIIDGHEINSDDFNRLRKIILYQNLPDYKDDSMVNKSIRDDQAKKQELLSSGMSSTSLERKIVCLVTATSMTFDDIYELSMRKFHMLIGTVNDLIEYKLNKVGLMSGAIKLKDGEKLEHWMYQKEKGLYDSAVDTEKFTKNIKSL